jgi:hypothetical protein
MAKTSLVVTSINSPNAVLRSLAEGAIKAGSNFIVIGDEKSPTDFTLEGCRFFSIASQRDLPFKFATVCPTRHYSRKNIGYLLALSEGSEIIVETDDDNFPREAFWNPRNRKVDARVQDSLGWINTYRYFTDANIWPRGFPLDEVTKDLPPLSDRIARVDAPIQQGLADENPDVDALYRLILPLPQSFRDEPPVALGNGAWCPFNSQNTTWWRDAAPLLYLPSYCSFRMTDIWRSFIAQRIAWANGWSVTFHSSTVWQDRNEHNLMKDFEDEIPGYLQNAKMISVLSNTELSAGVDNIPDNLTRCYEALISAEIMTIDELTLLNAWLTVTCTPVCPRL